MSTACAGGPRIRHALRGRLRIHVPGLTEPHRQAIEGRLARLPGVRSVRASALTGNVLVQFDPTTTAEDVLLAELGRVETVSLTSPSAPPDRPALAPAVLRLGSTLVGGVLLAARRLGLWTGAFPGARALATLAGILASLTAVAPVRGTLQHMLGPGTAGWLSHVMGLLAALLNDDAFGLAIGALQALLLIGKALLAGA
jgi:hypothetical protein